MTVGWTFLGLPRKVHLVVEAEFAYADDGRGLTRVVTAADHAGDGVYSKANNGGASRIFCCFDQPDLRAPISLSVRAPSRRCCRANSPAVSEPTDGGGGVWRFAPTAPLAPYLFALCAGPDRGNLLATSIEAGVPIPLTAWAPFTTADRLDADELADLVGQSIRYHERALGVRYPYPKLDLVFVPGFPALAYSPPGLSTLQDRLLDPSQQQSDLYLPCVLAHETAHSWFGGMMDMRYEKDGWLQEALATWASRAALEQIRPGSTPWAPATSSTLPDHAYSQDAAVLCQLEEMIGRPALLEGLGVVMDHYGHGTVTIADLAEAWSQTSGREVRRWATQTLHARTEIQQHQD